MIRIYLISSTSATTAALGPSPPRTGRIACGSTSPAPTSTALLTRPVLAGDGGSVEIASAQRIFVDEGNVQLPSKAQWAIATGTRTASLGRVSCAIAAALVGMPFLPSFAPFGFPLGVVVVIELLELVPFELGIGPLVTAPDVVMMMTVMVLVIQLVILLDLIWPLLVAKLRLECLERPGKEAGHNVFWLVLETLPETGHLEQAADAARFANKDVIEHGSLPEDGKFVAGALLLRIAEGEGVKDGSAGHQLRGCNLTHEREFWHLRLLCELNTSKGHRQWNRWVAALAIETIWPVLLAVGSDHGAK